MAVVLCCKHPPGRLAWRPRPDGLEEAVMFTPGYDCPRRGMDGHGHKGMEISWYLRGPAGAAVFTLDTDWFPAGEAGWPHGPVGKVIGSHGHRPKHESQDPQSLDCDLTGGLCFWNFSCLRAAELVPRFRRLGEPVIWAELQCLYEDLAFRDG